MKNIRVVIFENGTPAAQAYASGLFDSLSVETHIVNVYDKRPCTQLIPVRCIPNPAVLLLADTLEGQQQVLDVLRQLDYIRREEDVTAIVDALIEAADPTKLTPELEEKITATFYGG